MNNQRIVVSVNLKRTIKNYEINRVNANRLFVANGRRNLCANNKTKCFRQRGDIRKCLRTNRKQSEFLFFYNLEEVNKNEKISIRKRNANIRTFWMPLPPKQALRYTIKDRHIVLTTEHVSNAAISQQSQKVTGVVSDLMGSVAGANVIQKGTTNGTTTDLDGKFSIEVPANATLQISFIGYISQDIAVKGQSIINVTLKEDSQALEEVVVVGYGTMKKKT